MLVFVSTRWDPLRVECSTTIVALPPNEFDSVNDFRRWTEWSPWESMDPQSKRTSSVAPSDVDMLHDWTGNKKEGTGRKAITSASAPSKVVIKHDFLNPFEAHKTSELAVESDAEAVRVAWAMFGSANFVSKLTGVLSGMDRMVDGSFKRGFANRKQISEA